MGFHLQLQWLLLHLLLLTVAAEARPAFQHQHWTQLRLACLCWHCWPYHLCLHKQQALLLHLVLPEQRQDLQRLRWRSLLPP